MPASEYLFTSESVSEGHPDKVCDLVSDSIVDAFLAEDPNSRVAVETMATTNLTVIAGETRGPDFSSTKIEDLVRNVIRGIGYEQRGFHWCDVKVEVHLHRQSDDIAMGVDAIGNKDEGAGFQGLRCLLLG